MKRGRKGVNQRAAVDCRKTGTRAEEHNVRDHRRGPFGNRPRGWNGRREGRRPCWPAPAEEQSVPLDAEAASVVAFHSALARGSVRAASVAAAVRPCPAPGAGRRSRSHGRWLACGLGVFFFSHRSLRSVALRCFGHRRTSGADHDVRRQAANPARASPSVDLRASLVELRRQGGVARAIAKVAVLRGARHLRRFPELPAREPFHRASGCFSFMRWNVAAARRAPPRGKPWAIRRR